MLRYFSIVETATSRVALEDIGLGGVTIAKDEGILIAGLAANWDESVFSRPDELDFHRGARPPRGLRLRRAPVPRPEPGPG